MLNDIQKKLHFRTSPKSTRLILDNCERKKTKKAKKFRILKYLQRVFFSFHVEFHYDLLAAGPAALPPPLPPPRIKRYRNEIICEIKELLFFLQKTCETEFAPKKIFICTIYLFQRGKKINVRNNII